MHRSRYPGIPPHIQHQELLRDAAWVRQCMNKHVIVVVNWSSTGHVFVYIYLYVTMCGCVWS